MPKTESDILLKGKKLGISPQDENFVDFEKRIMAYERAARDHKLFIIALISGVASVLSALAALIAVLK